MHICVKRGFDRNWMGLFWSIRDGGKKERFQGARICGKDKRVKAWGHSGLSHIQLAPIKIGDSLGVVGTQPALRWPASDREKGLHMHVERQEGWLNPRSDYPLSQRLWGGVQEPQKAIFAWVCNCRRSQRRHVKMGAGEGFRENSRYASLLPHWIPLRELALGPRRNRDPLHLREKLPTYRGDQRMATTSQGSGSPVWAVNCPSMGSSQIWM